METNIASQMKSANLLNTSVDITNDSAISEPQEK